ncbi:MAG: winged helix-turn-helix transcriptional regulator [Halohasta sp.]
MTVDHDENSHPIDSPPDETILDLLEEHKVLPTTTVADEVNSSPETTRQRLRMMAKAGLIEHRQTVKGDVWLTW